MIPSVSQMEAVLAVAREGHFGRAAKACFVTQPSLSMQIQKVEEYFGAVLFDRGQKPVGLTPAGEKFVGLAQNVLAAHRHLRDAMQQKAGQVSGDLSVAVIPTLGPYLLPLFLQSFSEKFPGIKLSVDEMQTEVILDRLHQHRLDAAILATPLNEPGIVEERLFDEPFFYYGTVDKAVMHQADLNPDEIWLLNEGHCLREQIVKFCDIKRDSNTLGNIQFTGGSLETLRNLVRSGQGETIFPFLFVKQLPKEERRTMVRSFADPVPVREISIIYRRDYWKKPLIDALAESIRGVLPDDLREFKNGTIRRIELR